MCGGGPTICSIESKNGRFNGIVSLRPPNTAQAGDGHDAPRSCATSSLQLICACKPGSERDAQVKHYEGAGEGRGRGCTLAVTLTIKNVTTPVPNTRTVNQRTRSRRRERIAVAPTEIDCERPERDLPEHPEAEQHDAVARDQPEVGACEGHVLLVPFPLPATPGISRRIQATMLAACKAMLVRRQPFRSRGCGTAKRNAPDRRRAR